MGMVTKGGEKSTKCGVGGDQEKQQLSFLDFILCALRKSMVLTCRIDEHQNEDLVSDVHHMEIGWPTNVNHITHVTFDRFHGFLGLPLEFEVEIPCKALGARYALNNSVSLSCIFRDIALMLKKLKNLTFLV